MSHVALVPTILIIGLVVVSAVMAFTAVRARQLGVVAVVDVAWGAGFVVVALVAAMLGSAAAVSAGGDIRRWLVAALVAVWGLRLSWHVRSRATGAGEVKEDPRYAEMLGGSLDEVGMATATKRVFAVQGGAMWLVSLPVMVGAALDLAWWPVLVLGVLVWGVGLAFEAVGDAQLERFMAQPRESRPKIMDQGLWGWTRHPNYFGDACVWWGLWLAAGLSSGLVAGLATVVAPVAMTLFLRNVTGAKLLEQKMSQREGWDEYAKRVPMFFPKPPRMGTGTKPGGNADADAPTTADDDATATAATATAATATEGDPDRDTSGEIHDGAGGPAREEADYTSTPEIDEGLAGQGEEIGGHVDGPPPPPDR